MEVLLKKTKITKSIVQQSLRGSNNLFVDQTNYELLGWCMIPGKNDVRWILLYNLLKSTVVVLPYSSASHSSITRHSEQTRNDKGWYDYPMFYYLNLYLPTFRTSILISKSKEEEKMEESEKKLKEFLEKVQNKGQVYL